MYKQSLTDRREMLGRLTLELSQKRGPLTAGELLKLRALRLEMDSLEPDIQVEHRMKRDRVFGKWLAGGLNSLSKEDRQLWGAEFRDESVAGAATGMAAGPGVYVPVGFQDTVTSALKSYGPMFRLSTIVDTPTGSSLPWPTVNDATISGELIGEAQQVSSQDVAAASTTPLKAYKFSSLMVRVSLEFIQDQGVNFADWLADQFAIRIERAASPYFITGTGAANNQPQGIVGAGTVAGTAVGSASNDGVGGANTIGSDDVSKLELNLDPAYRGTASFLTHPNTLAALRKVKSRQGDRIFPEIDSGKLFGYPLETSPFVDQLQTGASSPTVTRNALIFASLPHYVIRRVRPTLLRLSERYIDFGDCAFILFWRMDGQLIDGNGGQSAQILQTVY